MGETSSDDRIRDQIRQALDNLLAQKLPSAGWEQVRSAIADIRERLASGDLDLEKVRSAVQSLPASGPVLAKKLQDRPLEEPVDEYTRERIGELKHRVRDPSGEQPADDE
ncbi:MULTISPECIES: CATRA system-associated protein [Protofrankia]|uniref:CATRA-Associated Small Protein domain-containing protein n=1 Tax=Candidatus Protofrankia datiscae TaxID=2716812 RepID=F8AYB8_9ACTN|nr:MULTISPECIES: CATRA system-associated protein [Protofrankia]AEH10421.1 hypothetical protein FsymDg_3112 [Candidatus Protofrankia datiscae]